MSSAKDNQTMKNAIDFLCSKYSNPKDVRKMTTKQQQFVVCASMLATLTFSHDVVDILVRFETGVNGINDRVKDELALQEGYGMSQGSIDFVFLEEHCTAIVSGRAQAEALREDFTIEMYKGGINDQKKLDEQIDLLAERTTKLANEMER